MKDLHTLVTVLEKVSDDKMIEAVSCAIKTEAIVDGVLMVLFVGTLLYAACKIVNAAYRN